MNYEEAVAYIDETPKFTKKNSLDHTKECLRRLGNPQDKFKVIHVAGTNGKGSTCAFLTSVLREAGYSCGLFTSPHLVEINERFQINEVNIDNDTFLKAFEKVKVLADELVAEGSYLLIHPYQPCQITDINLLLIILLYVSQGCLDCFNSPVMILLCYFKQRIAR